MKLWPHQAKFLKENPAKAILAWEMRTGKTLPASIWIDDPKQAGNTFIVSPKRNKKDWMRLGTKATVLSKEEFKKYAKEIKNPTAIVIDEAHYFASGLFLPGRSQLATALYTLVKDYPNMHVLLLTATPIRQDAISLHTLLCYIGEYYPWKGWREQFFHKESAYYLPYPAWVPNDDWRIKIRPYLEKHCDIISLRDIVDDLPPMDPVFIEVKHTTKERLPTDAHWMDEHKMEQRDKGKEIMKLGYRKILIVAHYTSQIDDLTEELSKDKPVFVLDGRTKDPDALKRAAQEADDCYFIVQSSMGFGFDAWMFGALVFASTSHSCVNHTQMLGRMRHLEHMKSVTPYYLMGGEWDHRIYETIEAGKDFNPHVYERATRSTKTNKKARS
jgi:superfamily II DNA or RNA helicase